ncbi:ubiquitin C-terminal hydrolase 13-like isoform X2 [Gastrolobium bilobum]|uniref:ubiquitin C-terminal hydrolase 13-like isoform X2 n=1 Tax=Gastrolobium bilobum TaxID=150636 RepID=UPI002AB277FD|nr:ubiquitin C-terminal hydrolase 13-like isoform X2 [Gastrolobium bilobum]
MEAQPEAIKTMESDPVKDPSSSRFTWRIENFSRLTKKELYSEIFIVGGHKWRVFIFPKGNHVDYLSLYLDVADSASLPNGWSIYANFNLTIVNQVYKKDSLIKEMQHEFNARESDWGFTYFMPLGELNDLCGGYIVNDTLVVEAKFIDLKKETGSVVLKKEQDEKVNKIKENEEAHLYTVIKVARDEDLAEQIGKDMYFDLVDHDKVRSFSVKYHMSFNLFKEDFAKEFGIPVQFQRFWLWQERQNYTYRPNRPLTHVEEAQSIGQLIWESNNFHNAELKLFLEVELGLDLRPIAPPDKEKDDILIFFKLYDPETEELRYVGRLFVKSTGKPSEILMRLNVMAGYDPDEEIGLYEEIKFKPNMVCEPIDNKLTFRDSQLEDGDIICFQKSPAMDSEKSVRYPDVPSYLDFVRTCQVVHFRSLDKPKEDSFCLKMTRIYTYDDVVEKVAQQLGLDDPSKIRLTPHDCSSKQPKPRPINYRGVKHLSDMLIHDDQASDMLYYEVLDIPLPELQGWKTLKVEFHHATKDEVVVHTIRLPKQSTVADVLDDLKTKVELSRPDVELRLLEVFYHKIYKVFSPNEKIKNLNDQYWTLRAEEIPEEEKNVPHGHLIHVYHFIKEAAQEQTKIKNFGKPFFLVVHKGETLSEIKVRIQKKLQITDYAFAKWKFAFVSSGRPEYLQDSEIVYSRFQRRDVYGAWEQYLGLEHNENGRIPIVQELGLLVSSNHLVKEDVPLLTEFLLKYPCVRIRDEAFTNKYRGFAYGCLAELLRFLGSCSVIDAAGDRKQEYDNLVADVRSCAFSEHSWLAHLIPFFEEF